MSGTTPIRLKLPGEKPTLTAEILPRGLTIHRLIVHTGEYDNDIVIGPEKPEDHLNQKYMNSIIGRYANRIPAGAYFIERRNIKSVFHARANEGDAVSLHGGAKGFDSNVWNVLSKDETPQLFSSAEVETIRSLHEDSYALFSLVSPYGDQGYPGEVLTEVLVALVGTPSPSKYGNVVLVYRAKMNGREKVVTPFNLTQHWGFNLDASLCGGRRTDATSVREHELAIASEAVANLDGFYLPTHEYSHVRTALSDMEFLNLLDRILINEDMDSPPSVQLQSQKAGMCLQFFSNQRGVMFYSNFLANPDYGNRKTIHGGSGVDGQGDSYGTWSAAFLEFHEPLAAFLQPANKNAEDTLLASDELYNNFIRLEKLNAAIYIFQELASGTFVGSSRSRPVFNDKSLCHQLLIVVFTAMPCSSPLQHRVHGEHGFVLYQPQFNELSQTGQELNDLLKRSMPDTFLDSSGRHPPPISHLGTRREYIDKVTNWAIGEPDKQQPMLWMHGPFGIGKTAVAQSFAEALEACMGTGEDQRP
ncbi:hypothetical protein NP233_g7314 [Leucocoprinus birnbaumii]|uniref:Uncharacterized protein n=1 Tax=Leucocoprinus birnbaumii TaxID=56174 RepID=A0AAD5YSW7_9AGAR|nr:hypothetical protein NP233_g7314 [Leucocoprinus birnbaumii]